MTLEQKIRNAIPELTELGVGCEIKYGSETIYTMSNIQKVGDESFGYLISKNDISNRKMIGCNDEKIEIIGKPIQLNHVLEYAYKSKSYKNSKIGQDIDIIMFIVSGWNLSSNLLSDQSPELKNFINELAW